MATTTSHRHFLNCEFGFKNVWTQASIKNTDGSTYVGHLDRFGNRVGFGTFKMRVDDCVYAAKDLPNRPSLEHWLEYTGVWKNDEPNGFGIMRRHLGQLGRSIVEYEGMWCNGEPADRSKGVA
jgi:hypothetical protein